MPISFVNYDKSALSAGGSKTIATAGISHTSGNLLVAVIGYCTNTTVSKVEDTAGNTYSLAKRKGPDGSNDCVEIWYAKNITGNANNVVTATFAASASYRQIHACQYSGCDTDSPLDVSSDGSGTGTSFSTSAVTTNQANEVIVAGFYTFKYEVFTAGTNFTLRSSGGSSQSCAIEDRIVSSTGSYGSAISTPVSTNWVGVHATFKGGWTPNEMYSETVIDDAEWDEPVGSQSGMFLIF